MKFDRFLLRFNAIGLALLILVISAMVGISFWQDFQHRSSHYQADVPELVKKMGTELPSDRGPVVLYDEQGSKTEARRNLRFVLMKTGQSVTLTEDVKADVYGGTILVTPGKDDGPSMGYLALVKKSKQGEIPNFDAVLVRFSDLKRVVLARSVRALDQPTALDDHTLSAIVWDQADLASFVIYDIDKGTTVASHQLDKLGPAPVITANRLEAGQAAPQNIYQ
jgi:hypothetical protein